MVRNVSPIIFFQNWCKNHFRLNYTKCMEINWSCFYKIYIMFDPLLELMFGIKWLFLRVNSNFDPLLEHRLGFTITFLKGNLCPNFYPLLEHKFGFKITFFKVNFFINFDPLLEHKLYSKITFFRVISAQILIPSWNIGLVIKWLLLRVISA